MLRLEKIFLSINVILYGFLVVFSYAYVDLNLTLSKNYLVTSFVKTMQQLGYFNRPIATTIYVSFLISAFSLFVYNLWLFYKKRVGTKYLAISTILNTLILVFAYPFLSSDLFNYLFDAKLILTYHVSPYTHRALDFPNDEWLRFMRWIHRYSPYGPLWLTMSLVPAILGFGKFILNMFAFKIFIAGFHLVNSLLIFKILKKNNPKKVLVGTAFYAMNPTLLIEGVANSHNDVVLATFLILPIYFLTFKRTIWSYLSTFAGMLIKYIPILTFPWLVWVTLVKKNKNLQVLVILNLITMSVFTYLFSSFRITVPFVSQGATQVQFQPWYLFWTMPFVALIPKTNLLLVAVAVSIGASLRYLPFLYYGDWSHPQTINFMKTALFFPAVTVLILILILKIGRIFKVNQKF